MNFEHYTIIDKCYNERLLNYVSMIGYMFVNSAISSGNTTLAKQYIAIYKRADPENPDVKKLEKQIETTTQSAISQ